MDGIYCGPAPLPADLLLRWNLDPVLLLALAACALFLRRSRAGLAAVGVLIIASVSPLCALSSALFSARAAHHLLLVAVAAPLIATACPARVARAVGPALAVFALSLWAWHAPVAYDLALSHKGVYWIMQLSLLGGAVWFWRQILAPAASLVTEGPLIVAAYGQMGLLGAVLTFAPTPLYAAHATAPLAFGLTPLGDQQLGGLLMWAPGGVPFAIVAAMLLERFWAQAESAEP
jgi:putative membrane protein